MLSEENLFLFGKRLHFSASKYAFPIDWDFKKRNVFTSNRQISFFRRFRLLCIFNLVNIISKTIYRKTAGPMGDFYFLWAFTVLYLINVVHIAVFVYRPKDFSNALAEAFNLIKYFDGKVIFLFKFNVQINLT